MSNLPIPNYYDQYTAKERSYVDYMGEINKSIGYAIEKNANNQIATNALFAGEIKQTLISNQIATENALYNHTQQINGTLTTGFSGVSRQLGDMGSAMSTGLALLNSTVQESSKAICSKLDAINDTLKNPLYTESRELYNRAFQNYIKGLYEEALEDLHGAINKNKTDPFSHFLLGQTYLYGLSEFCNVIDLNAAIEALRNATKYITHDAKTHKEASLMASEIWFYLGLAYQTKANDDLHNSKKTDYEKNINDAKVAYSKSWNYSNKMLESLYNLARCKILTIDIDGSIKDLTEVILTDHGYLIKIYTDSDFDNVFKNKFINQFKKLLYPKTKDVFDRINIKKNEFQGPYSVNLNQLFKNSIFNNFSENTPPFDLLEATNIFKNILSFLEKEQMNHEEEQKKERTKHEEKQKWQKRFEEQKKYNCCIGSTIGLKTDGTVVATGWNSQGRCDTGDWRDIIAVSAGGDKNFGLTADGTVVAVGRNDQCCCNWRNIIAISAGYSHIVGLKTDGTVIAVGENKDGQCNTGSWRDIIAISAGHHHTVGLKTDGTVIAVGKNENGQCNIGNWRDIIAISAGGYHIVGLKADSTVIAVGKNENGQCNMGSWREIIAISAGYSHTVGLKTDGTVVAVGENKDRRCDIGTWRNIIAISAKREWTVGLKEDGIVVAIGFNINNECNTGGWRNVGPYNKEQALELARQEKQRRIEQSKNWQEQGLCPHCGGQLGGLFTKKCKSCGK